MVSRLHIDSIYFLRLGVLVALRLNSDLAGKRKSAPGFEGKGGASDFDRPWSWFTHVYVKADFFYSKAPGLFDKQLPNILLFGLSKGWLFSFQFTWSISYFDVDNAFQHPLYFLEILLTPRDFLRTQFRNKLLMKLLIRSLFDNLASTKRTLFIDKERLEQTFVAKDVVTVSYHWPKERLVAYSAFMLLKKFLCSHRLFLSSNLNRFYIFFSLNLWSLLYFLGLEYHSFLDLSRRRQRYIFFLKLTRASASKVWFFLKWLCVRGRMFPGGYGHQLWSFNLFNLNQFHYLRLFFLNFLAFIHREVLDLFPTLFGQWLRFRLRIGFVFPVSLDCKMQFSFFSVHPWEEADHLLPNVVGDPEGMVWGTVCIKLSVFEFLIEKLALPNGVPIIFDIVYQ